MIILDFVIHLLMPTENWPAEQQERPGLDCIILASKRDLSKQPKQLPFQDQLRHRCRYRGYFFALPRLAFSIDRIASTYHISA